MTWLDKFHMKLEGKLADLLTKLKPDLSSKYLCTVHGKSVICMKLRKELYERLLAAMLFWKYLTKTITDWNYIVNPYYRHGKQCILLLHVDGLKISHIGKDTVRSMINYLS